MTIGTLTMKIEPHQKCSSRNPPATGPMATAMPATPAHSPIATARSRASVKTFVRIESVAGMMNAAPMPITARAAMSASTLDANAAAPDEMPNSDEPRGERALAAVAIAERSRGEEQAGEHERVGVDDPLQIADARPEVAHQGGERHVDDRVVDHDHEEAHAEHRERAPPTRVECGSDRAACARVRRARG